MLKLPRSHVKRTAQQKLPVTTPKQWGKAPQRETETPEQDADKSKQLAIKVE